MLDSFTLPSSINNLEYAPAACKIFLIRRLINHAAKVYGIASACLRVSVALPGIKLSKYFPLDSI